MNLQQVSFALLVVLLISSCQSSRPEFPADQIFYGGSIITLAEGNPLATAVAVREGQIVAVGDSAEIFRWQGETTKLWNLSGQTLCPGFIDTHSHFADYSFIQHWPDLSPPPFGKTMTFADIKQVVDAFIAEQDIPAGQPVIGFGYDDAIMIEHEHPTTKELDAFFPNHPVFLIHVSGHLAATNSAGLKLLQYTDQSVNPPGGVLRRNSQGRLTGVIEESALLPVFQWLAPASPEAAMSGLGDLQLRYAAQGFTTIQDGLTQKATLDLLRVAAANGVLRLDVVSYPRWDFAVPLPDSLFGSYRNHLKIGGVKITQDGSPQGKTAYLTQPYLNPPPGLDKTYRGYPAMPQAKLDSIIQLFWSRKKQILVHANGDAAIDMVLEAFDNVQTQSGKADLRPVIIHAQTARIDQLDKMKNLGLIPSFFTAHTFFWGDWHRSETLGPDRTDHISPMRAALDRNLRPNMHCDAPVIYPSSAYLLWTAVNRLTRSGVICGEEERITPFEALRALTLDAAYMYGEEKEKGSIEPGKKADLVLLRQNPLEIDPMALRELEVIATFKDGQLVYQRQE